MQGRCTFVSKFTGPNPDTKFEPYLNAEATTAAPSVCKLSMDDMELGR